MLNWLPNILTSSRMGLTFIYLVLQYNLCLHSNNRICFIAAILTFTLICLTDLLDGRIARKIGAVSKAGSILDVASDFIFIISSLVLLSVNNMIPAWFIVMVLIKFIEFLVTSRIMRNYQSSSSNLFIFDCFGRIAAANFFLIPGMVSLVYIGLDIIFINIFIYITSILVVLSSSARCINCYKILQLEVE